jgi:hypothetical protein
MVLVRCQHWKHWFISASRYTDGIKHEEYN